MIVFTFLIKRSFRFKNDEEKMKKETDVFKRSYYKTEGGAELV